MYEQNMTLNQTSTQHWLASEVFSSGWFLILGTLVVAYVVWLKLLDKSRAKEILLIGSLASVAFMMVSMVLFRQLGKVEFKIRLLPLEMPMFINAVTLSPIIIMLVHQYTSSWRGYMLWCGIGFALYSFALVPVYNSIGIAQMHNWNIFFHFIVVFGNSLIIRCGYLWIADAEKRHTHTHENA